MLSAKQTWVAVGVAAVGGLLVHASALDAGYAPDDYLQLAMVDGSFPTRRAPWDLFALVHAGEVAALQDGGVLPWFAHPDLKLAALRPLASLLVWFDYRVLRSIWLMHVHSFVWYVALLIVLAALVRRMLPKTVTALAVLLFALDAAHAIPLALVANRALLLSAVFGVVGLWAHHRHRAEGWRPGALAPVGFALSLLCGEYGLPMLGYLLAYEAFFSRDGWGRRATALAPAAILGALYFAAHVALDYGARASAVYVDPLEAPGDFAREALDRLPALLGSELVLSAASALETTALGLWPSVVAAVALLTGLGVAAPGLRAHGRPIAFFAGGALLSLLPLLAAPPSSRLLVLPSIGGSAAMAWLIIAAWQAARERRGAARWLARASAAALGAVHLIGAPIEARHRVSDWAGQHAIARRILAAAPLDDRILGSQTVVLLNMLDSFSVVTTPWIRHEQGHPLPRNFRVLTMTEQRLVVRRTSADSFELVTTAGMLQTPGAWFFRDLGRPLAEGQRFELDGMTVQVLEKGLWGPSRLFYRIAGLGSPSVAFLELRPEGLRHFALPPIGFERRVEPVTLAYEAMERMR